jgi:mRNA-degrading endonuclease RelE of RelBE toxin-antitoxin system
MYKIIFDEKVIQFMEKLDYNIRFNIFDNLRIIKKDPLEFAKRLNEVYLIQLDKFRVIVDIDKKSKLIKILFIKRNK